MIGAPLSSTASLYTATPFGSSAAPAVARSTGLGWLDGLGSHSAAATLRADVAPDQRGLSVQQHAERVLSALVG
jgi:hypothetical protein